MDASSQAPSRKSEYEWDNSDRSAAEFPDRETRNARLVQAEPDFKLTDGLMREAA